MLIVRRGAVAVRRFTGQDDILAAKGFRLWDEDVAVPGPEGLLMQIFNLVPRAVWADKPVFETTQFLQAHYGYGWFGLGYYTDIVMTPFTEAYAFVGLPGALFLMFVLGVFFQAVYMTLVGRTGGRWNTGVVIYAVLAFDMLFNQFTIAGMLAPLRDMILMLGFLTVVLERRLPTARGRRPLPTKPQPAVDVFSESRGHR